jgi:hypothetical protein
VRQVDALEGGVVEGTVEESVVRACAVRYRSASRAGKASLLKGRSGTRPGSLLTFCVEQKITFTPSRVDGPQSALSVAAAGNDFFTPQQKLKFKTRDGAKITKKASGAFRGEKPPRTRAGTRTESGHRLVRQHAHPPLVGTL